MEHLGVWFLVFLDCLSSKIAWLDQGLKDTVLLKMAVASFQLHIPFSRATPPPTGILWVKFMRTPGTDGMLPVTGDCEGDKKHIFDHFFTKQTQDV